MKKVLESFVVGIICTIVLIVMLIILVVFVLMLVVSWWHFAQGNIGLGFLFAIPAFLILSIYIAHDYYEDRYSKEG